MYDLQFGTVAQWGSFVTLLGILVTLIVAVVKVLPEWMRARNERARDIASERRGALEEWRVLQGQVAKDLADCRHERAQDAERLQRQDDEIFRLRVVLSMALAELEQIDPASQIILKAQALLLVPPAPGILQDSAKMTLDQLLEQLAEREARRSARSGGEREGHSGSPTD